MIMISNNYRVLSIYKKIKKFYTHIIYILNSIFYTFKLFNILLNVCANSITE